MSYPQKLYVRAVLALGAIGVVYLVVLVSSSYVALRDAAKYGAMFLFLLGFLYYPLNKWLVDRIDAMTDPVLRKLVSSAKHAKRGIDGEDVVAGWLEEAIGKGNFLRNVKLPGRLFDFDAIAVGEWGVVVLEVKNYSAALRFADEVCYIERAGKWTLLPWAYDPRAKIPDRVYALRRYLDDNGFEGIPIYRSLVIAGGNVSWSGSPGTFVIKDKVSLSAYVRSLRPDPACTADVRAAILRSLQKGYGKSL